MVSSYLKGGEPRIFSGRSSSAAGYFRQSDKVRKRSFETRTGSFCRKSPELVRQGWEGWRAKRSQSVAKRRTVAEGEHPTGGRVGRARHGGHSARPTGQPDRRDSGGGAQKKTNNYSYNKSKVTTHHSMQEHIAFKKRNCSGDNAGHKFLRVVSRTVSSYLQL